MELRDYLAVDCLYDLPVSIVTDHRALPRFGDNLQALDACAADSLQYDRKLDDQAWPKRRVFIPARWRGPEALILHGDVVNIETVLTIREDFVPKYPVHVVRAPRNA
jgi:hypothetical protein